MEGALCHPCSNHSMVQSLGMEEALGPLRQPGISRHLPHWYLEEQRADAAHPHTIFHGSATQLYTTNNHILGVDNSVADVFSCLQFHRFRQLAPEADPDPTPTPATVISH